jgi:hypothetical protein
METKGGNPSFLYDREEIRIYNRVFMVCLIVLTFMLTYMFMQNYMYKENFAPYGSILVPSIYNSTAGFDFPDQYNQNTDPYKYN